MDDLSPEEVRAAYARIAASDDPEAAPVAAVELGVLLAGGGDLDGAADAFRRAVASGHPEIAPRAAGNLGLVLLDLDDVAGARAAFERAVASGHERQAPKAAVNLGRLREAEGDLAGARAAYRIAIDSGHDDLAAAGRMAVLRQQLVHAEGPDRADPAVTPGTPRGRWPSRSPRPASPHPGRVRRPRRA